MPDAGWKQDPSGAHQLRYWDGVQWTDNVSEEGKTSVDRYNPQAVPPPPERVGSSFEHQRGSGNYSYRLTLYNRREQPIHEAPYASPDAAMQFANDNPQLRLRHSIGSVLLKGAAKPNMVRWARAVITKVDQATGDETEYHSLEQGRW